MFVILFIYCYNGIKINNYEGMETENSNLNKSERALLLALKNNAALASINNKLKSLNNLNERFTKIENSVKINQKGIEKLTNKVSQFTTSLGNQK
tara:strand:- start:533 stop:817 length:285 start_codon:yes stop_codon:yes gene_type:complete